MTHKQNIEFQTNAKHEDMVMNMGYNTLIHYAPIDPWWIMFFYNIDASPTLHIILNTSPYKVIIFSFKQVNSTHHIV